MAGGDRKNADGALITALASGATVAAAAEQAGVSERTVYRRLEDDSFRGQLAEARAELIKRAVGRLARDCSAAADTLRALLTAESETVRLGAAKSIIELAVKIREHDELAERVAALEQQHAANEPPRGVRAWGARTAARTT